jgi:hypothetical protein
LNARRRGGIAHGFCQTRGGADQRGSMRPAVSLDAADETVVRHGIDDGGMPEIADHTLQIKAVQTVRHFVAFLSVLVGTLALSVSAPHSGLRRTLSG